MIKPKVVLLIFVSGKIVLTGAKVSFAVVRDPVTPVIGHITSVFADSSLQVREEIYTAFNTIYTVLCEFRKP